MHQPVYGLQKITETPARAQVSDQISDKKALSEGSEITIKKIIIKGNDKTKDYIILNESELLEGQSYNRKDLDEARARLLNLEIFSEVGLKLKSKAKSRNKTLIISVKERWTTIPILKFSSGGGISEMILGAYNVNLLGRYVEAGAQYQRLGDRNSGVVWTKLPRLTKKLQLDLQAWNSSRIRIKYNQNSNDPIVENGFTQNRNKLFFNLNYRRRYSQIFGVFYEYNKDSFDNDLEFEDFSNGNVVLPERSEFNFIGLNFTLGRIDIYREKFSGKRFTGFYRYAFGSGSNQDFHELSLKYEYFKQLGASFNFASRTLFGSNDNDRNIQYLFYYGGLDSIRGFKDNRFSGNTALVSNNELRYSMWRSKYFTLQGTSFLDFISVSGELSNLLKENALSAGLGVRFFFPQFYRFVVRFDYATPLEKDDDESFSFGIQQFF